MEKTKHFHIVFQKLVIEKYAKSLLGYKMMITFFLLNTFFFCSPISSCVIFVFNLLFHGNSALLFSDVYQKKM